MKRYGVITACRRRCRLPSSPRVDVSGRMVGDDAEIEYKNGMPDAYFDACCRHQRARYDAASV